MILEICKYDEIVGEIINIEDFQSSIDCYFFLLAITQQQKLTDGLNKKPENVGIAATTNRTLSDRLYVNQLPL